MSIFSGELFKNGIVKVNTDRIPLNQKLIFGSVVLIFFVIKILLIPYNMVDSGDNITRVWNALWWSQKPFFVLPESGHPLWFYFMGPLIKITGELYYTPVITMTILMTIAGIYIFKTAFLIADFKTALLSYIIVTLSPAIFRLNFEPYPQQLFLASVSVMLFYLLKAFSAEKSNTYFLIAGIFGFIGCMALCNCFFAVPGFMDVNKLRGLRLAF
jgi:hypothetical protein